MSILETILLFEAIYFIHYMISNLEIYLSFISSNGITLIKTNQYKHVQLYKHNVLKTYYYDNRI